MNDSEEPTEDKIEDPAIQEAIMEEQLQALNELMLPEKSVKQIGISLYIDILNNGKLNVLFDFNNPDDETCKSCALFLTMTETGNLYNVFISRIKDLIKEKDKNVLQAIRTVFKYKEEIDQNIDQAAVLPRDVFR